MSFSTEWEESYKANRQVNNWPFTELISTYYRYARLEEGAPVLEMGFGTGPNAVFFKTIGLDYYGIEGSASAVSYAVEKYPELEGKLAVADFTKEIPFDKKFKLIFDRGSLSHNSTSALERCADLIYDNLTDDGVFIGIDWFSSSSDLVDKGVYEGEDKRTMTQMHEGCAANLGEVHFSDKMHLMEIFHKFEFLMITHKIINYEFPLPAHKDAYWNFVIRKKR